ncbi:unnamed protein product [Ilex paraguariensis]|uniref:Uncharacterized protein n=1 Tax=Ilex paraguariensis TaxID=185542 RepID=A0ABC8R6P6_9AQUA
MNDHSGCFDPNTIEEVLAEDRFSHTHVPNCNPNFSIEELSYHQNFSQEDDPAYNGVAPAAVEVELQQLSMEQEHYYDPNSNHSDTYLMQEAVHDSDHALSGDQSNWETNVHDMQSMSFCHYAHQQDQNLQQEEIQNGHFQGLNSSSLPVTPYPPTPDLLNLLHLPRYSSSSATQCINLHYKPNPDLR